MATMYILKGTYTESGREFFLDKDGYVVNNIQYLRAHECYSSIKGAKIAATRKTKTNAELVAYDKARNERRAAKGLEPFKAFNACVYEPYALEI